MPKCVNSSKTGSRKFSRNPYFLLLIQKKAKMMTNPVTSVLIILSMQFTSFDFMFQDGDVALFIIHKFLTKHEVENLWKRSTIVLIIFFCAFHPI